jgi:diadenosine tetraphosphate (Ap4A) HIT family hydrolase
VPGHLLVIPKRHIEKSSQLTKAERKEIFDAIINIEEKLVKKFSKGCDIRSHYRPFMKQSWLKVNHLHFHLQPREFEDELYQKAQKYELDVWRELPEDEIKVIKKIFTL